MTTGRNTTRNAADGPAAARGVLRAAARPPGFTLMELMVVIAVILTVIVVTLPAIGRIVESANYSSAINLVTASLGNARAAAMRQQRHTAVAFLFDSKEQKYTLLPLERYGGQGSLTTRPTGQSSASAMIFSPALGVVPIELPRGTGVYGLSFAIARQSEGPINQGAGGLPPTAAWYAGEVVNETTPSSRVVPWIFPRNDPRLFIHADLYNYADPDPWLNENGVLDMTGDRRAAVRHANSFCVVFSPLGSVEGGATLGELSLENAYIEYPDAPYDTTDPKKKPYDDPTLFDPEVDERFDDGSSVSTGVRNPEVVLRTVSQLAVVELQQLSSGTGVEKPWLLHSSGSGEGNGMGAPWPTYRDSAGEALSNTQLDEKVIEVSRWIDDNAEIIAFDRYTGSALRKR